MLDSGAPVRLRPHAFDLLCEALASGRGDRLCPRSSMEYALDGKAPVTVKAGDALFIPAGTIHSAKNVGSGNVAELATYLVEKGRPLIVPVN